MPETRPQPEEPRHTFTARYKVIGRSFTDQLLKWAEQDPYDEHDWVDTTAINSPDYTWICSGCGLTKAEPRTHWPLYPEDT